jgi:hypothetical protein
MFQTRSSRCWSTIARCKWTFRELSLAPTDPTSATDRPDLNLEVIQLPPIPDDPMYVKSLNEKPGILALAMEKDAEGNLQALPFVVPGARFNEMYNWDSVGNRTLQAGTDSPVLYGTGAACRRSP